MALGLVGRVKALENFHNPRNRFIDIAYRLVIYRKNSRNKLVATKKKSKLYGGVWDRWSACYTGTPPEHIIELPVSKGQYDYCLSTKPRITGKGGRGGGKSEALAIKTALNQVDLPGEHCLIVSPTYDLGKIVWGKILDRIPNEWLLPGAKGVSTTERTIRLINGSTMRFRSADRPDSLRSFGASYCAVDEEADVPDEAIDVAWGCLRLTDTPQMYGAGTPKIGMYQERYNRMVAKPEDNEVFSFPSRDNPFIPHNVFDQMKNQMDDRRYRQEVLAEFISLEENPLVCYDFNSDVHTVHLPVDSVDITQIVTKKRIGRAFKYIIGVDYNWNFPNYAAIYKVYKNPSPKPREPNIWVLVDIIPAKGNAGHLGKAIKKAGIDKGYEAKDMVVIDDATGRYNKGPRSSSRLLRAEGFSVRHPSVNPPVVDRINAYLAKLSPVDGDPSWFIGLPQCEEMVDCCENLMYNDNGKVDKSSGYDHLFDACTYPLAYFEPAARWKMPKLRGVVRV